jgi:hypothetical protein
MSGVYGICGLYCFIITIQVAYLLSYQEFDDAIIYVTLIHFFTYFAIQVTVFTMLLRMGSGLHLVPHKLTNNQIQYEGYDKDGKHLFTFTMSE